MIAIKEKDAIYFVSPLKYQNCLNSAKLDYSFEENWDVWRVNDGKGTIVMVGARNNRLIDLLRYSDVFDCEMSKDGMNEVFAKIRDTVRDTNCIAKKGELGATVCIARGNKGYRISPNGAVFELGGFECVQECEEMMLATNEYCKSIPDVIERIRRMYDRIGELDCRQYYPVAVVSTKDDKGILLKND